MFKKAKRPTAQKDRTSNGVEEESTTATSSTTNDSNEMQQDRSNTNTSNKQTSSNNNNDMNIDQQPLNLKQQSKITLIEDQEMSESVTSSEHNVTKNEKPKNQHKRKLQAPPPSFLSSLNSDNNHSKNNNDNNNNNQAHSNQQTSKSMYSKEYLEMLKKNSSNYVSTTKPTPNYSQQNNNNENNSNIEEINTMEDLQNSTIGKNISGIQNNKRKMDYDDEAMNDVVYEGEQDQPTLVMDEEQRKMLNEMQSNNSINNKKKPQQQQQQQSRTQFEPGVDVSDRILDSNETEKLEEQEDEEDAEYKQWELQQIKKGGAVISDADKSKQKQQKKKQLGALQHKSLPMEPMPLVSIEEIQSKIQTELKNAKFAFDKQKRDFQGLEHELEETNKQIQKLDVDCKVGVQDVVYFQRLRDHVNDICDCMSVKVPKIDKLEEKFANLEAERVEASLKRYSNSSTWPENPDLPLVFPIAQTATVKNETTSDVSVDKEPYETRRKHFEHDSEKLFDDTADEYHSISEIANFFNDWRKTHLETYKLAYVSLTLPNLFAPLVKYELLKWRPLIDEAQPKSIMELDQFKLLKNFSTSPITNARGQIDQDKDLERLPAIVLEKAILPKLLYYVQNVWDIHSAHQTFLLQTLFKELSTLLNGEDSFREFSAAIVNQIQASIDILPPTIDTPKFCSSLIRFFGVLTSWVGILSVDFMERILVGNFLNNRIIPYLNQSNDLNFILTSSSEIVSYLPLIWRDPVQVRLVQLFLQSLPKKFPTINAQQKQSLATTFQTLNDSQSITQLKLRQ